MGPLKSMANLLWDTFTSLVGGAFFEIEAPNFPPQKKSLSSKNIGPGGLILLAPKEGASTLDFFQ